MHRVKLKLERPLLDPRGKPLQDGASVSAAYDEKHSNWNSKGCSNFEEKVTAPVAGWHLTSSHLSPFVHSAISSMLFMVNVDFD